MCVCARACDRPSGHQQKHRHGLVINTYAVTSPRATSNPTSQNTGLRCLWLGRVGTSLLGRCNSNRRLHRRLATWLQGRDRQSTLFPFHVTRQKACCRQRTAARQQRRGRGSEHGHRRRPFWSHYRDRDSGRHRHMLLRLRDRATGDSHSSKQTKQRPTHVRQHTVSTQGPASLRMPSCHDLPPPFYPTTAPGYRLIAAQGARAEESHTTKPCS